MKYNKTKEFYYEDTIISYAVVAICFCTQEGTEVQKFNLAPSVSIQSPEEGSYFDERTEIVFEALIATTQMIHF